MTRIVIDPVGLRESARTLRSVADGLLELAQRLGLDVAPAIAAQLTTELASIRGVVSSISRDAAANARELDRRAETVEHAGTRWWNIAAGPVECCCRLPTGELVTIRTAGPARVAKFFPPVSIGAVRTAASSASGRAASGAVIIGGAAGTQLAGSSGRSSAGASVMIGGAAASLTAPSSPASAGTSVMIGGATSGVTALGGSDRAPSVGAAVAIGGGTRSLDVGAIASIDRQYSSMLLPGPRMPLAGTSAVSPLTLNPFLIGNSYSTLYGSERSVMNMVMSTDIFN
jgi:hypothetical protein